jgi:hypothetical protein
MRNKHKTRRMTRLVLQSFESPTDNETMKVFYDPMRPRKSPRYAMTREQLRDLARKHGVQRGRNTADTVTNLRKAGIPLENAMDEGRRTQKIETTTIPL